MSLSHKINDWVENGILTAEQGAAVVAFERDRKSLLSPIGALILLGVFSIGTGIVALVAANWQDIPDSFKLTVLFALLTGTAYAADAFRLKKLVFEGLLTAEMLLFLAAIGLIGQIYHLHSDAYKPMLFWSFLAFFPLLQTQKMILTAVWEFVFFFAFMLSPWGREFARFLGRYFNTPVTYSAAALFLFGALTQVRKAELFVAPLRKAAIVFAMIPLMFSERLFPTGADAALCFVLAAGAAGYSFLSGKAYKSVYAVCILYACFVSIPKSFLLFFGQTGILIALLFAGVETKRFGFARVMAFVACLRVIAAYFELFGSLLETGGGLILTGLFILGIAYGWHKADRRLKAEKKQ